MNNRKVKIQEEFVKEVSEINPNIEVIGQYINRVTKLKFKCKIDGTEWEASPDSFKKTRTPCPTCRKKIKIHKEPTELYKKYKNINHQDFIKIMKDINTDIEIMGEYKNFSTKIKCKCKKDSTHIWETRPSRLLEGYGCPLCNKIKQNEKSKMSSDEFLKRVHVLHGDKINVLGEYKGTKETIKAQCTVCGHIWEPRAGYLIAKNLRGCPICAHKQRIKTKTRPLDFFYEQIKKINPDIEIIGEYKNSVTPVRCKCKIDGYEWEATVKNLLKGTGCPKCNTSHGERKIKQVLDENNIEYRVQYCFDGCKNKRALPFDFYLPEYNVCIEYDGQQHYRPVTFGGISEEKSKEHFKDTVKNDNKKNKFCQDNGIKLIRIPYYDFDKIEQIIKEEIISNIQ